MDPSVKIIIKTQDDTNFFFLFVTEQIQFLICGLQEILRGRSLELILRITVLGALDELLTWSADVVGVRACRGEGGQYRFIVF